MSDVDHGDLDLDTIVSRSPSVLGQISPDHVLYYKIQILTILVMVCDTDMQEGWLKAEARKWNDEEKRSKIRITEIKANSGWPSLATSVALYPQQARLCTQGTT